MHPLVLTAFSGHNAAFFFYFRHASLGSRELSREKSLGNVAPKRTIRAEISARSRARGTRTGPYIDTYIKSRSFGAPAEELSSENPWRERERRSLRPCSLIFLCLSCCFSDGVAPISFQSSIWVIEEESSIPMTRFRAILFTRKNDTT